MTCNSCENNFQNASSVVVSIVQSGSNALVYVQNHGRNIVMLRRILLCYTTAGGWGMLYLRPPGSAITWTYPSEFLESGITALFYSISQSNRETIQAQAEYVELEGRSRSCVMEL